MSDQEIRELLALHEAFTIKVEDLIRSILNVAGIKSHIIESRTKDFDSLKEKISRKNINNIVEEITDLTGLRIILFYQSDIETVEKILRDNFNIDEDNSVDKSEILKSNEFGYLSLHYVAQLANNRNELPEWAKYEVLKIEIQVRTILQHAWASISHEITYKKQEDLPQELNRKLHRLAGLFELADEQFEIIKNENQELLTKYEAKSGDESLDDQPISILSIEAVFNTEKIDIRELIEKVIETGFVIDENNKNKDENISQIKYLATIQGINTIKELNSVLRQSIPKTKILTKKMLAQVASWSSNKYFITILALLTNITEQQMSQFADEYNWNNSAWNYISIAKKYADNKP